MKAQGTRTIHVSRAFFEELEQLLYADERYTIGPDDQGPGSGWPLVLLTPSGRKLKFVMRRP